MGVALMVMSVLFFVYSSPSDIHTSYVATPIISHTQEFIHENSDIREVETGRIRYLVVDGLLATSTTYTQSKQLENTQHHKIIWEMYTHVLDDVVEDKMAIFEVFYDPNDSATAYVELLDSSEDTWLLAVNIAEPRKLNADILYPTFIHESAHIITLENDQLYSNKRDTCTTYLVTEGCMKEDSYIYRFYERFWENKSGYQEAVYKAHEEEDRKHAQHLRDALYETHRNEFVSRYGATNPEEDLAESFTAFVIYDMPKGNLRRDEKIRFFYDIPELVETRSHIRSHISVEGLTLSHVE